MLNSQSKINVMTPVYIAQLGFKVQKTNIGCQKIDGFSLTNYNIIIAILFIFDKLGCSWFFQETFLLVNISMEVVLGMLFLTFNNINV